MYLKILISTHARANMSKNVMLVETKACCHVANAFLGRLELIWPISNLKISKMSKKCIFGKSSNSQWVVHQVDFTFQWYIASLKPTFPLNNQLFHKHIETKHLLKLARQSQMVQSVMYSSAIHSWFVLT